MQGQILGLCKQYIYLYSYGYFAGVRFQNFPRKCFRSNSTTRLKQMTVDIFIQDINWHCIGCRVTPNAILQQIFEQEIGIQRLYSSIYVIEWIPIYDTPHIKKTQIAGTTQYLQLQIKKKSTTQWQALSQSLIFLQSWYIYLHCPSAILQNNHNTRPYFVKNSTHSMVRKCVLCNIESVSILTTIFNEL